MELIKIKNCKFNTKKLFPDNGTKNLTHLKMSNTKIISNARGCSVIIRNKIPRSSPQQKFSKIKLT